MGVCAHTLDGRTDGVGKAAASLMAAKKPPRIPWHGRGRTSKRVSGRPVSSPSLPTFRLSLKVDPSLGQDCVLRTYVPTCILGAAQDDDDDDDAVRFMSRHYFSSEEQKGEKRSLNVTGYLSFVRWSVSLFCGHLWTTKDTFSVHRTLMEAEYLFKAWCENSTASNENIRTM